MKLCYKCNFVGRKIEETLKQKRDHDYNRAVMNGVRPLLLMLYYYNYFIRTAWYVAIYKAEAEPTCTLCFYLLFEVFPVTKETATS